MIRTPKLEKYLPEFVQEYREIKKIMETEDAEFQIADNQSEIIKDNLFIESCDEKGISRFESMLGITPLETDTLQSRISRVMTRWNESLPYTDNFLIRKLNSLCGAGNYKLTTDYANFYLELVTHLTLSGQIEELLLLFDEVVPANLTYELDNKIILDSTSEIKTCGGIVFCDIIGISS